MMLSGDSGQGESICTPRSVSKRLFGAGGSSSKRNLFSHANRVSQDTELSGDESDLGPMSPLAITDHSESSCDSSPGRHFVSPFTTPEKSPRTLDIRSWDRLRPLSAKNKSSSSLSPFSALRISTQAARSSPKRKILQDSPKSFPLTPRRKYIGENLRGTPEREIALLFTGIVPETPQKDSSDCEDLDRVEETPQKDEEPERRLITPLGSVLKQIVVPRLHRRKSLCPFVNEESSPPERKENVLKRHANDSLASSSTKFPKIAENSSIPKARASLFREKKENTPKLINDITLSTKSFYKTSGKRGRSMGPDWKDTVPTKKRHSLPSYASNHTYHRRPPKRQKFGEMNAGVRHGIKRPKPKRHVSRVEAFKKEKQKALPESGSSPENPDAKKIEKDSNNSKIKSPATFVFGKTERSPSPVVDPNKRFFKTNRTLQSHHMATVTVNNKIKLNVSDGKIALNEKHSQISRNQRKKARLEEISFDTTDLTVDEPGFDTSIQKRNVDGILKVLEDDWANDEYDTMETLTAVSPTKSVAARVNSAMMSPASVLSNMTSSMNIEDAGVSSIGRRIDDKGSAESSETSEGASSADKKLYPLFAKGYSTGLVDLPCPGECDTIKKSAATVQDGTVKGDGPREIMEKKTPRGIKRSWQTSMKSGCGGAEDQYQIDAGQKRFGATACTECGIVYQLGDPEDENAHLNYHNSYKTLKFNGWKKERVIMTDPFTNSRIIAIEPSDPKQCWRKVEEVLAVVDRDLGLAEMELSSYLNKTVYFYVRDKTILGVMMAENIKTAHRMIPELLELDCCSDEETPAKCGVNVIWTAMSNRRQHIATKLLDTVRATYYFGYIMSIDDIAFSMPTPNGKIFAEKYTKTRNFKVYS